MKQGLVCGNTLLLQPWSAQEVTQNDPLHSAPTTTSKREACSAEGRTFLLHGDLSQTAVA